MDTDVVDTVGRNLNHCGEGLGCIGGPSHIGRVDQHVIAKDILALAYTGLNALRIVGSHAPGVEQEQVLLACLELEGG